MTDPAAGPASRPKITIGIKALNEARHIERAILSALAAIDGMDGEVVVADSGSTDDTVAIARRHPVRVVQFADLSERCCGAGAQLAFQHSNGEFFYLLDGDMTLHRDFIMAGIDYLENHAGVAAVGGHVREMNIVGEGFQIRARAVASDANWRPGPVDRLDCGGLYRRSAIEQSGWFADRNLHAFEEFELAARLRAWGWTLARIDRPAVDHYGHLMSGYALLWRRVRSGYSGAVGEVLRSAIGQPQGGVVLRDMTHIRHGVIIIAYWMILLATALLFWPAMLPLLALPVLFLSWRRGSFRLGLYSFTEWNVVAWGLITGFCRKRRPPGVAIRSVDLHLPAAAPR